MYSTPRKVKACASVCACDCTPLLKKTAYTLLDGGSQCTIVRNDVTKMLELSGQNETINISTIKDTGSSINTKNVSFQLSSLDESYKVFIDNVYSVNNENFNVPSRQFPKGYGKSKQWKYILNLTLSNDLHRDKKRSSWLSSSNKDPIWLGSNGCP